MSSSTAIKVQKVSKDKQADATDSKNDDLQNAYDSRESVEDKEPKEGPKSKTTKKNTKKTSQAKEQGITSTEEAKESQGEQEIAKKEDQKVVEQGAIEGKAAKKGKNQKKADDKIADQANSQVNTELNEKDQDKKQKELEKTEQSKPKKTGQKVEPATSKKPELVVQADLTANKPKAKETEVKSPNLKVKETAAPVKTEPQKIISLNELKKPEKEAPLAKQKESNPTNESLPSNRKDLTVDAENKKIKTAGNQKSIQSPKSPPVIDLSAAKYAAPQTTTSPKPTIEKPKTASQRPANLPVSPAATENKPIEGLLSAAKVAENKASPKNPLKEVNVAGKDVKSPRNAKAPGQKAEVVETKKVEENPKNLSRKPTAALEKQKTIPLNDKSLNVKSNTKAEPIQARVYTEGNEKIKPTSAAQRTAAKSPQTFRQTGSTAKNPDYFSPRLEDKNKANKVPQSEKPRMRSFDAGKTDKINPEDPFEARCKMWQIRKQEKLLQEEKKQRRKETQECTFSPRLNQKSLSKHLSPYDIYERGVEWNEKVQSTLTEQREKHLEELRKPIITKAHVKSGSFVPEPRRSTLEGFTGPQFGTSRAGVPAYSHEPLEYNANLENQITEIREIFDNITSTLKAKASKNSGTYRAPEQQETPRTKTEESRKTEKVPSSQFKPNATKSPVFETQKEDANRIDSLKGILNLKQDAKRVKGKEQPKKSRGSEEVHDYFIGEEIAKNPRQIEIRNNRYVLIDQNLSAIEKRDTVESNDASLNFESTEAK